MPIEGSRFTTQYLYMHVYAKIFSLHLVDKTNRNGRASIINQARQQNTRLVKCLLQPHGRASSRAGARFALCGCCAANLPTEKTEISNNFLLILCFHHTHMAYRYQVSLVVWWQSSERSTHVSSLFME